MVNTITAGVIAPAVFHSPKAMAVAMLALMLTGFALALYYRDTRRRGLKP
jgi:hypothetical protein